MNAIDAAVVRVVRRECNLHLSGELTWICPFIANVGRDTVRAGRDFWSGGRAITPVAEIPPCQFV
jgi:hypothetical protein